MVTYPTMNGSTGNEVYSPPKNFGQSFRKILGSSCSKSRCRPAHPRQRFAEPPLSCGTDIPSPRGSLAFPAEAPALQANASATVQANDRKASEPWGATPKDGGFYVVK